MKEIIDKEIIKALECCISGKPCEEIKCPLYKTDCEPDLYALEKYALNLINRQKAEIESEKQAYSRLAECYENVTEELDGVRQKRASYENMFLELGFSLADVKDIELKEIKAWKDRMILHVRQCDKLHRELQTAKSEIERLTEEINALNGNTEKYIAECEKRSKEIAEDYRKEIKFEAIKEFAEELKRYFYYPYEGVINSENIDNLVKEITESEDT